MTAVNLAYDLLRVIIVTDDCRRRAAHSAPAGVSSSRTRARCSASSAWSALLVALAMAVVGWSRRRASRSSRGCRSSSLIVVPLQVAAWLVRGLVFQYVGLDGARRRIRRSIGASRCRTSAGRRRLSGCNAHDAIRAVLLPRRRVAARVRDPQDGRRARPGARHDFVRARLSGRGHVPVGRRSPRSRASCSRATTDRSCSTGRRAATSRCATRSSRSWPSATSTATRRTRCIVTTGSQQGLDLIARVLLRSGRRRARRTAVLHGRDHGVSQRRRVARRRAAGRGRDRSRRARRDVVRPARRRPPRQVPVRRARISRIRRGCSDRASPSGRAARVGRAARRAHHRGRSRIAICISPTSRRRPTRAPIAADDRERRVVYLSSFSKTLAPGFRVRVDARARAASSPKLELAKQAERSCARAGSTSASSTKRAGAACSRANLPKLRAHYQRKRDVMVQRAAHASRRHARRGRSRAAAFSSGPKLAGARSQTRRAAAARASARRDLRRRLGVLRRRRRRTSTCACRSRRRRPIGSKRAWPGSRRPCTTRSRRASAGPRTAGAR